MYLNLKISWHFVVDLRTNLPATRAILSHVPGGAARGACPGVQNTRGRVGFSTDAPPSPVLRRVYI
jgi:hypothetical protein